MRPAQAQVNVEQSAPVSIVSQAADRGCTPRYERISSPPRRVGPCRAGRGSLWPRHSRRLENRAQKAKIPAMDSFELNKIIGAVLGTLLFVMGVGFLAEAIYHPIQDRGPGYTLPEPVVAEAGGEPAAPAEARRAARSAARQRRCRPPARPRCASARAATTSGRARTTRPARCSMTSSGGRKAATRALPIRALLAHQCGRRHLDVRESRSLPGLAQGLRSGHQDDLRRRQGSGGARQHPRLPADAVGQPGRLPGARGRGCCAGRARRRPPMPPLRPCRPKAAPSPRRPNRRARRRSRARRPPVRRPAPSLPLRLQRLPRLRPKPLRRHPRRTNPLRASFHRAAPLVRLICLGETCHDLAAASGRFQRAPLGRWLCRRPARPQGGDARRQL